VRLGIDSRLEAESIMEDGEHEPDTGGFIAYFSPEVVASPMTDLVVRALVRIPAINALNGRHDEGLIVVLGAMYDF
jgi:hypothetical protein